MASNGIFDLPVNQDDDDEADEAEAVAARKKKNAKLSVVVDEKQRNEQRKAAKEKRDFAKLQDMVTEKASAKGAKNIDKAFDDDDNAGAKGKRKAGNRSERRKRQRTVD
jgi:hypothetical protein